MIDTTQLAAAGVILALMVVLAGNLYVLVRHDAAARETILARDVTITELRMAIQTRNADLSEYRARTDATVELLTSLRDYLLVGDTMHIAAQVLINELEAPLNSPIDRARKRPAL